MDRSFVDPLDSPGPSRLRSSPIPVPISPLVPLSTRRKRRSANDDDDDINMANGLDGASSLQPALRGGGHPRNRPRRGTGTSPHRKRPPDAVRKRVTRAQARRGSSPSLTTDLENIAAEDAAVKKEILRLNLGLRDVQGDGNCLFRALADQLWGVQKRHVEVRKLVCDYLETNKDSMEAFVWPFLKEGEGYEGYVERMRQLKQFGSHIEIQAAARVFRRNIRVVMSTTSFTIPWETETSSAPNSSSPNGREPRRRTRSSTTSLLSTPAAPPPSSPSYATALADYIPSIRPGRSMLWLALFSQAEHFQSVRRKGDGDSGAAEIEDRLAIPHERDLSEAARRERGEIVDSDSPSGPSTKVTQVLASLPLGHGVSEATAAGVLARVKGDLGEAVEILLEDLNLEERSNHSDHLVDTMLDDSAYRDQSSSRSTSRSGSEPSDKTSTTSKVTTPSAHSDKDAVPDMTELKVIPAPPVPKNPARMRGRRAKALAVQ